MTEAVEMVLIPKQRYEKLSSREPVQQTEEEKPPEKDAADTEEEEATRVVLSHIPENLKPQTMRVLAYVNRHKESIDLTWDKQGRVSFRGKKIPGSHIQDLLKDAVFPHKAEPTGMKEFYQALADMNLPDSLVHNTLRKPLLRRYKMGEPEPELTPPGTLEHEHKSRDDDEPKPLKRPKPIPKGNGKRKKMEGIYKKWISL